MWPKNKSIAVGTDIGTKFVKACLVRDKAILAEAVVASNKEPRQLIARIIKEVVQKSGVSRWKIGHFAITGHGALHGLQSHDAHNEIPCIAKAAHILMPEIRTVIHVGGLFTNVILLKENGSVADSSKNDVCAAGGGELLEICCEKMRTDLSHVSDIAATSKQQYSLASNCAVFAESEIITQINAGMPSSEIFAGVLRSLAARAVTLTRRISIKEPYAISGGLALIPEFKRMLEQELGKKIQEFPINPMFVAAYGTALLAQGF